MFVGNFEAIRILNRAIALDVNFKKREGNQLLRFSFLLRAVSGIVAQAKAERFADSIEISIKMR